MIEFTLDEINNLVLSAIARLSTGDISSKFGISYNLLSGDVCSGIENLLNIIQTLYENDYIECDISKKDPQIKITEKGIGVISKNDTLSLDEVSKLLISKTYEIYKRNNSNISLLFNSLKMGGILGISKFNLINAGIVGLKSDGLIKVKLATYLYTNYTITVKGIRVIEKSNKNSVDSSNVLKDISKVNGTVNVNIYHSQLNLASTSATINAVQNINLHEVDRLFECLIKEIPETIFEEVETQVQEIRDGIKSELQNPKPKISMVKTLLTGLKGLVNTAGFISSVIAIEQFVEHMLE